LLRSMNGGIDWTWIPSVFFGFDRKIYDVLPLSNDVVLVASDFTNGGGGLLRTVDGGSTFLRLAGASNGGLPGGHVTGLAVDPTNGLVYAAMPGKGVFRSANAGNKAVAMPTWEAINTGITDLPGSTRVTLAVSDATTGGFHPVYVGVLRQPQATLLAVAGHTTTSLDLDNITGFHGGDSITLNASPDAGQLGFTVIGQSGTGAGLTAPG